MEETSHDTILAGYGFASELSRASGLPLSFITAPMALVGSLGDEAFDCPVLPIQRQLVPPWLLAEKITLPDSRTPGGATDIG